MGKDLKLTASDGFKLGAYRADPAALDRHYLPLRGKAGPSVLTFFALEPSSEYVDRSHIICVRLKATADAAEALLGAPIFGAHPLASQAVLTRMMRRHDKERTATPAEFVGELATKLVPTLIEDSLVEAGFGFDVSSRLIRCAGRGL